jgi:hypothetical protein
MPPRPKAAMIIRFVNGRVLKLSFETESDELHAMRRVNEALTAQHLVVELPDRALVIPVHNIQVLEILSPAKRLPSYALRGAQLLS